MQPRDIRELVGKLLGEDPICCGRVGTATVSAIADLAAPMPLLAFDEAEQVGRALHDHWVKMAGEAPMGADDMGWADVVQFVARKAREIADERISNG
jgi:hypothetical protein